MKRVPMRVLMMVLLTGVVSIISEFILAQVRGDIVQKHQQIIKECWEAQKGISDIRETLYKHQSLLANSVMDAEENQEYYVQEEKEVRENLSEMIKKLEKRMRGNKREQLYHKVYSNYCGYQGNADTILQFCAEGSRDMAVYYNNTTLKEFLTEIDENLDKLSVYTETYIEEQQKEMADAIELAVIVERVCMIVVIGIIFVCSIYCVKITRGLDQYKEELEKEIVKKNEVIQKRNEKMIHLQEGIIIGMANLIESRDGDTGEHVKRTSAYVRLIAEAARERGVYAEELTQTYIDCLVKAAPLHDVGKIAIPDQILNKPGKLTEAEFEAIKRHSLKGGRIIREIFEPIIEDEQYLKIAVDVASFHHEKWDGSGYMKHLKGQEIPLSARIMAIADVFDALVSQRCYKEALSVDEAFEIITESSGSHFDPKLVKVFLEIRPQIEEILEQEKNRGT
ncbi:MAG: HD-GYP domain-containing protein [Lachnospiraceae bacterium]